MDKRLVPLGIAIVITAAAAAVTGYGMSGQLGTFTTALTWFATAAAAAATATSLLGELFRGREVRELDEQAKQLSKIANTQIGLREFVSTLLDEASARQQILSIKAEGRLQTLYMLGVVLTVCAVLVPFIQVGLYMRIDSVLQAQRLLKLGLASSDVATLAGRDWHLLLVGASFGLLFLAAARGVLFAEERQREAYFRLNDAVSYYANLSRYLRIAERAELDDDLGSGPTREAIIEIQTQLLRRAQRERSDTAQTSLPNEQPISEILKTLAETLKK